MSLSLCNIKLVIVLTETFVVLTETFGTVLHSTSVKENDGIEVITKEPFFAILT